MIELTVEAIEKEEGPLYVDAKQLSRDLSVVSLPGLKVVSFHGDTGKVTIQCSALTLAQQNKVQVEVEKQARVITLSEIQ